MNELFDDRPAPWTVEKFQRGYAAVIDANGATVLTVNGVALAEFIADAANAFASDDNNNAEKIAVLTIQRDAARAALHDLAAIADAQSFQLSNAQARIALLESAARGLIEYRNRNPLNFQLEKADTFINRLAAALAGDALAKG